ncbi:unnamed protein product [Effrenium voratum]|nr:unnamed protein product [Effrenium voratum]
MQWSLPGHDSYTQLDQRLFIGKEGQAAERKAQIERDLQDLARRLHVPRAAGGSRAEVSKMVSEPIDLHALAGKVGSRKLGSGEVECRPAWRRTLQEGLATE